MLIECCQKCDMFRPHKTINMGCTILKETLKFIYIVTRRCGAWFIWQVLDWINGFIASYTFTTRDYRQYSAIAILHTFQFTVAPALGFSGFTSRILATDLSQSHCHFKSYMKSSYHTLIPSLPLFCTCQFDSWLLFSTLLYCRTLLITTLNGPRRKQPVLLTRRVYRAVA
jgi:hypothetical protein